MPIRTEPVRVLVALLMFAVRPCPLRAQAAADVHLVSIAANGPNAVTRRAAPCSYADCALRVERSFGSGPRLVRGITGSLAADLGVLRFSELLPLFAGNDSASVYAAQYIKAARVNHPLTLAGIVLGAVGLAQQERVNAYTLAGASMLAVSVPFQYVEERALSRAVWWYNSALLAGPVQH